MAEDTLDMRDEDRLPWLEAVEEDGDEGISVGKMVGGILLALLAIAVVVGGIFWLRDRNADPADGAELIAAPEEDYRIRPSEAGGMEVEGEGDAAFEASEGGSPEGQIDSNATPEEPVSGRRVASNDGESSGGDSTARIPASNQRLDESAPRRESAGTSRSSSNVPSASSGRLIQLGAYSSQAAANAAWAQLTGRRSFLGSLNKTVTSVDAGGRTLYRLRAVASSADAARQACSRLRSAGEACSVVVN